MDRYSSRIPRPDRTPELSAATSAQAVTANHHRPAANGILQEAAPTQLLQHDFSSTGCQPATAVPVDVGRPSQLPVISAVGYFAPQTC